MEDIHESGRLALGKRSAVSTPEVKHFFFQTHYLLINKNSNQSIKFSGSRMKNAMKCSIVLKQTTTETLIMGSLPKSSNTAKKMTEFHTGELIELITYSYCKRFYCYISILKSLPFIILKICSN